MKRERSTLIVLAKALSDVFRPSYYPLVGIVILLLFTYLSLLPWQWKLGVLVLVYFWTLFLPGIGVYLHRKAARLSLQELTLHRNRIMPYLLHIICYGFLLHILYNVSAPSFLKGLIIISLLLQCVCTLITIWWKISMHSAGVGAIIGALVAYSAIFHFNPVWWLCLAILVSGLVNCSRMLLRQHTLGQVLGGTLVGFVCGLVGFFV